MANNTANVSAAKPAVAGAISVAPVTTAAPTDATSTLAAAFKGLGYVSEDGLTNANSPSVEWIRAWGGDNVLAVYQAKEDTYSFTLLEVLNEDVLKTVYGSSNIVKTTNSSGTNFTVKHNNNALSAQMFVFDMILTNNTVKRIVVPSAYLQDISEITYADGSAIGYQVTIGAVPDSSGNTAYEYIHIPA